MTQRDLDLYGDDDRVRAVLHDAQVWAVVGLGDNPSRPAYGVAQLLQSKGRRIVPVHPSAAAVHGEPGYPTLAAARESVGPIDVVDCFVNPGVVGGVVDAAIAIGARAVWMQLGVVDEDAARRARDAGLLTVMDRCPQVAWPRLGPS